MNVISIPLDKIVVGERLRAVDEDYAASLAENMARHQQRTPIEVRRADRKGLYRLIAGAHRVRALQLASIAEAQAIVLDVDDDEARLLEIDENLARRELNALDRAVFLLERKRIYEALSPETRHGGDRKSSSRIGCDLIPERFTKATAERLGYSERTIQNAILLAQRLTADTRQAIASSRVAYDGAQLEALSRLDPELQLQVAKELAEAGERLRVADVVAELLKRPKPVPPDEFERFKAKWDRRYSPEIKTRIRAYVTRGEIAPGRAA